MNIELKNMGLEPHNKSFNVIAEVYENGECLGAMIRYVHADPEFLRCGSKREDFCYNMGKEVGQDAICEISDDYDNEEELEKLTRKEFQAYLDRELEDAWDHAYGFDKPIEEDWV